MNPTTDKKQRQYLEGIFAIAAALDQSGLLRNTIYCFEKTIFIMNGDNTVLLKFNLPKHISEFHEPISFKANDYESGKLYEKDGHVCFQLEGKSDDEFTRLKTCKTPGLSFNDVNKIWENFQVPVRSSFSIHKKSLSLIERNLSHLEFSSVDQSLVIKQHDIFSGTVITLTRKSQGFKISSPDKIQCDFGPIGIRTPDFISLFSFHNLIEFGIPVDRQGFLLLKSNNMSGIISWCVYDELGILEVLSDGRKK